MALQLRRGINSQRATTTLAPGELVYVTDNLVAQVSPLYIGDGSTTGGVPVVRVVSVNTRTGAVVLNTDDITEGTTNKYYLAERAQDDVAAALVAGVHTGITFTYNSTPQDSGNRIDAVVSATGNINSGSINRLAYYAAAGTALSNTASLTWDDVTNNLTVDSGVINIVAGNGPRPMLNLTSYNDAVKANTLTFRRSRGSQSLPTPVGVNDELGAVAFSAYDGNGFYESARIASYISGTLSDNITPSSIGLFVTDTLGVLRQPFRVNNDGRTFIGPASSIELGTGSLRIISTTNPGTHVTASISVSTYFNGADGQNFSFARARGTLASPAPIQNGDDVLDFSFLGYDGANNPLVAAISCIVDGAVSTGIVPGSLVFSVANLSGVPSAVVKINNQSGTGNGLLSVTGTVSASVAIKTGVFANDAARNTAIPVPSVGMIIFNTATGKFEGNTDGFQSGWVALN